MAKTGKIARPAGTTTGSTSKADLSGRVEVFSLYEVFEMLSSGRKSGQLKITTPYAEGRCAINRGDRPLRVMVCHWSRTRPVLSTNGHSGVGAACSLPGLMGMSRARPPLPR